MRISTTTLESYRLFMQPDQEWMSEEDLIASIKGEFKPTPAVQLGLAYGRILEDPDKYLVPGGYACNGYGFDLKDIDPALALMDRRRGVFEAKAEKRYGDWTVVAKADQLVGAHLIEHKTTCGTFNFEKYAESYQWRFMADIFLPALITYHVFCLDDHGNGVAELKEIHSFNLFPYADLQADCWALLREFVGFVEAKGLGDLLRQRQKDAA